MRARLAVTLIVAGCGFDAPASPAVDATAIDAPLSPDAPDALVVYDARPLSCLERWRSGTAPTFGTPVALDFDLATALERDPMIARISGSLYFSSNRVTSGDTDIFAAPAASSTGTFGTPVREPVLSTVAEYDGKLTMTADELFAIGTHPNSSAVDKMVAYSRTSAEQPWVLGDQAVVATPTMGPASLDAELSFDGLQVFFSRVLAGQAHQSILVAERGQRAQPFGVGIPVFTDPQNTVNYADPALSADALVFLFTATLPYTDAMGTAHSDTELWYTWRQQIAGDLREHPPVHIASLGSLFEDGDAALSTDGCTVYFSSTRGGGNDYDLYAARMQP